MSAACVHYWKLHTLIIACLYCDISLLGFFRAQMYKQSNGPKFRGRQRICGSLVLFSAQHVTDKTSVYITVNVVVLLEQRPLSRKCLFLMFTDCDFLTFSTKKVLWRKLADSLIEEFGGPSTPKQTENKKSLK